MAWKEYCAEYWLKELQESMDRCTGRRNITEVQLKTASQLNTIQSINLSQWLYWLIPMKGFNFIRSSCPGFFFFFFWGGGGGFKMKVTYILLMRNSIHIHNILVVIS